MKQKGLIHYVPLLVVTALATAVILLTKNFSQPPPQVKLASSSGQVNKVASNPKITATPSAVPTFSPTPIPSPFSLNSPTPVPTEKPSPQPASGPPGSGLSNINVATEKGNFQAIVLSVDLNSAKMITDTADDSDCANDCKALTLKEFVEKNNGFAGVNGSYFCPDTYPECSSKKNSFDFPAYNSRLNKWINQGNLFWNDRAIIYQDGSGMHYLQNAKDFNGGLSAGLVNYPGILDGGAIQIDENQSGLSDKQKAKGTKVGIGVSNDKNVLVVIAQNVTMYEFAHVFKSLGAKKALNLDTGGSTALYYNGSYLVGPGRNIPNAIIMK